jgi:hypothetical protein
MRCIPPLLVLAIAAIQCGAPLFANEPLGVSLVQLIATPERYHGKLVRVVGFLRIEFEGDALYLHEEDYRHRINKNAIWIDVPPEARNKHSLNNRYVIAEGVFDGDRRGHFDAYSGTRKGVKLRGRLVYSSRDRGGIMRAVGCWTTAAPDPSAGLDPSHSRPP